MTITSLSAREFNQDTGRAKKCAQTGPVVITDRGKPAFVLLSIDDYERLNAGRPSIVELLSMPGLSDIDVAFPRSRALPKVADPQ